MDAYQAGALLARAMMGEGGIRSCRENVRGSPFVSGNPFQERTNAENVRGVIRQIATQWREGGADFARLFVRGQAGHVGGPYSAVIDGVPVAEALARSLPPDGGNVRRWGEQIEAGAGEVLDAAGHLDY